MRKKHTIGLIHQAISAASLKGIRPGTEWLFFGRDHLMRKKWEALLGNEFKINYKKELTGISYEMRDEFVEWSALIGRPHWNKWFWWITRIATRSNLISPVYLYLCYLEVLKRQLQREPRDLVIISESYELMEVIDNAFRLNYEIITPCGPRHGLRRSIYKTAETIKFFSSWIRYFGRSFYEWAASRLSAIGCPAKDAHLFDPAHTVIHTCVDDMCMGDSGEFRDRYFPGFSRHIGNTNEKVSTLVWLSNVRKKNAFQAFRWFRENRESFLIPQDYYNLYDCARSCAYVIRSGFLNVKERAVFKGLDVSPILAREQQLQRRNSAAAYFVNYMAMFRRWKKLGYGLKTYFDFWELKYSEVPSLVAIKQNYPGCRRVACQYGALVPKLLFAGYKTTAEEFAASPHADMGLANSAITREFLIREGFPSWFVHTGPAIRYRYLSETKERITSGGIFNVVVCLPLRQPVALEMLEVCFDAFREPAAGISLIFKEHPFMPLDELKKNISFKWPGHFGITGESAEYCIPKAGCLVISESSAMVEGVYKNVFTIVYEKETDIDIIPLDIIDEAASGWRRVRTSEELKDSVLESFIGKAVGVNKDMPFFEFSWDGVDKILSGK